MKCPYCNMDQYRSLKAGRFCRSCGNIVHKVLGEWWNDDVYSGIGVLVEMLVHHILDFNCYFDLKAPDERRERHFAASLIRSCDYDIELASAILVEAMHLLNDFTSIRMATWNIARQGSLSVRIARAKRKLGKQQERDQRQLKVAQLAEQRKDLFSESSDQGMETDS